MSERKKILVVDDDDAVTDVLQAKLQSHYEVLATNEPREALPLARSEQPDLVVCDIDMPGMDGGAVCRALAEDPQTRHIRFLYLTGMVSVQEVQSLEGDVGGRPGISKGAPIAQIVARIARLLGD